MNILETASNTLSSVASALMGRGQNKSSKRIDDLFSQDKEARRPREKQWQINMNYYLGNQWIGWNPATWLVEDLKAPSYRRQSVDNKLYVKTRAAVTRLVQKPGVQVIPLSMDLIDERRARTKESVLQHVEREVRMDLRRMEAATWAQVCGTAYWDVHWKEDAGDTYAHESGLVSEGEVGVRVRSPFEVWPGASCSSDNWGGRLWVCDLVHVDIARIRFNNDKIAPDAGTIYDARLRARLSSFSSSSATFSDQSSEQKSLADLVAVFTLYEFSSLAVPGGRKSTIVNSSVADEVPKLDWFGIVPYHASFNFSSFYGDTQLRQGIPAQKSHNRIISSVEEYTSVFKGKWVAHESSKIRKIDSEHGEILVYSGAAGPPTAHTPPSLPADLYNLDAARAGSLDDIFSDHPVSQGKAASTASGAAINYLLEADAQGHTPNLVLWEASQEKVYEKILDVAADNYDEARRIIVLGEDGMADVQDVTPELLAGRNRVRVVVGSALPASKVLRTELVRREFVDGMLGDPAAPETRKKALKMIDAGIVKDVYSDEYLDEARADRENKLMAAGQMPVPGVEEGHLTHIRVHKRDMKGRAYESYPPNIKIIYEQHLFMTEQMAMMEAAMAPPPPGAPGQEENNQPPASAPANGPGTVAKGVGQAAEPPPSPGSGQSAQ